MVLLHEMTSTFRPRYPRSAPAHWLDFLAPSLFLNSSSLLSSPPKYGSIAKPGTRRNETSLFGWNGDRALFGIRDELSGLGGGPMEAAIPLMISGSIWVRVIGWRWCWRWETRQVVEDWLMLRLGCVALGYGLVQVYNMLLGISGHNWEFQGKKRQLLSSPYMYVCIIRRTLRGLVVCGCDLASDALGNCSSHGSFWLVRFIVHGPFGVLRSVWSLRSTV